MAESELSIHRQMLNEYGWRLHDLEKAMKQKPLPGTFKKRTPAKREMYQIEGMFRLISFMEQEGCDQATLDTLLKGADVIAKKGKFLNSVLEAKKNDEV